MSTTEEIIGAVEKMTVLELAELVKALQDRFGVVAAAPAAAGGAAPAAAATAAPVEEQTEFNVILEGFANWQSLWLCAALAVLAFNLARVRDATG